MVLSVLSINLKRSVTLALAALLFFASLLPLLNRQQANAYALAPNRSITMSSSAASATPVTYHVKFDVATTGTTGGIVVQFCGNSPIVGDTTCSAIAGFTVGTPAVSGQSNGSNTDPVNGDTGTANISTLTTTAAIGTSAVSISNAVAPSLTAGQKAFFDITTITNPSTSNQTFYARIYTFATQAQAQAYTVATPGTSVDAGGIAMSTANQITITSKVQERLTFCVYTAASFTTGTDNNCTAKSGSTINLGDTNGVLDSAGPFVDKTAYYGVTTNAAGSAAIRMKGDTLELTPACAAPSCRIEAVGAVAAASTAGSEQFGVCTYQRDGAGMTLTALYNSGGLDCPGTAQTSGTASTGGAGTSTFAFDTANANTTYGQTIASKPAGAFSTGNLVFVGNISNTTEPGIYTTALTFIATGTY